MNGFIKLHRKLIDWQWYSDTVVKCVFLHLLLNASYKNKKWRNITIHAGQLVTGYKSLSNALGFSVQQIRTAINKLKVSGEITCESTNKYTVVTITKWDDYQFSDISAFSDFTPTVNQLANNTQLTSNQLLNDSQTTLSEEYIKYKNLKNINNNYIVMFDNAREKLKSSISPYTFNAWFCSLELLTVDKNIVVLCVDRKYVASVIKNEYMQMLADAFCDAFGDVSVNLLYKYE